MCLLFEGGGLFPDAGCVLQDPGSYSSDGSTWQQRRITSSPWACPLRSCCDTLQHRTSAIETRRHGGHCPVVLWESNTAAGSERVLSRQCGRTTVLRMKVPELASSSSVALLSLLPVIPRQAPLWTSTAAFPIGIDRLTILVRRT